MSCEQDADEIPSGFNLPESSQKEASPKQAVVRRERRSVMTALFAELHEKTDKVLDLAAGAPGAAQEIFSPQQIEEVETYAAGVGSGSNGSGAIGSGRGRRDSPPLTGACP